MMKSKSFASGAVLFEIPYFKDARGALNVLEIRNCLPFDCQRIFYTYSVPSACVRGEHAHKACQQFLISLQGRIDVTVDDGCGHRDHFVLDSPSKGLLVPARRWGEQFGHSPNNILLVLASASYDDADYIRDFAEFKKWVSERA